MGEIRYRVTVTPVNREPFAMEMFETQSDARAYRDEFLKAEDNILDGMEGAFSVTMEELYMGSWIVTERKLVRP